jgi:hypothetical protein
MSNDPAERLRQSNEVTITAVLELDGSDGAASTMAMMSDPVRIPVRLEWTSGGSGGGGSAPVSRRRQLAPAAAPVAHDRPDGVMAPITVRRGPRRQRFEI